MLPSNTIEKYSLRQAPCDGRPFLGAYRAYTTACDLYSPGGICVPMPTLRLPVASVLAPRPVKFRCLIEQACSRFTLYLHKTVLGSETGGVPTPMLIDLLIGQECAEESMVVALVIPPTFTDATEIVSISTSKLAESIAIAGIVRDDVGAQIQGVDLRIVCDWRGACCAPRFGPNSTLFNPELPA